jgi:dTDP-4-amino-4,6-dideoxygalactose transaminase
MSTGVAPRRIRMSEPSIGVAEEELVLAVLRSGHLAQGPVVARFEELGRRMAGAAHAVAVANGTVALEAALWLAGVGPGDEVITSPLTFAATLNAIVHTGATARFADVRGDLTIDPSSVSDIVSDRTRVILPVHLYGLCADMVELQRLANEHDLLLVEDAAQAHGASCAGRPAGSWGIGCFSFYATKNVAAGEGGLVTVPDDASARRLRVFRNQGMEQRYEYILPGRNWRLTDLAAAVAVPQMERLQELNARRARNASMLTRLLAVEPSIVTPWVPDGRTHVWHQYTVLLPEDVERAGAVRRMAEMHVDTGVYYPTLVWDHACYRALETVVCDPTPRAGAIVDRCLSLPVHPGLSDGDLEQVADALVAAVRAGRLDQV